MTKIKDKKSKEEFVLPYYGYGQIGNSVKNYFIEIQGQNVILSYESNIGGIQRWIPKDVTDEYEIVK